jgi:ABC-type phosphate/phosphonate transport system ATPase subunit
MVMVVVVILACIARPLVMTTQGSVSFRDPLKCSRSTWIRISIGMVSQSESLVRGLDLLYRVALTIPTKVSFSNWSQMTQGGGKQKIVPTFCNPSAL